MKANLAGFAHRISLVDSPRQTRRYEGFVFSCVPGFLLKNPGGFRSWNFARCLTAQNPPLQRVTVQFFVGAGLFELLIGALRLEKPARHRSLHTRMREPAIMGGFRFYPAFLDSC
jgi:hypothetical protein